MSEKTIQEKIQDAVLEIKLQQIELLKAQARKCNAEAKAIDKN